MKGLTDIIHGITKITKWISFWLLVLMVPMVAYFSISRTLGYPVIGDIEIVQFSMVILIMGSLAYTESANAHITIGLVVDRFPLSVQKFLGLLAHLATILFCFIVCWAFISKINPLQQSDLLGISFVPFKVFLVICFIGWALEALLKFIHSFAGEAAQSE